MRFFDKGFVDLGEINFSDEEIKSLLFFFKLKYEEPLADSHTLLTRGEPLDNGYLRISLEKVPEGRVFKIEIAGDPQKPVNTYTYTADTVI